MASNSIFSIHHQVITTELPHKGSERSFIELNPNHVTAYKILLCLIRPSQVRMITR